MSIRRSTALVLLLALFAGLFAGCSDANGAVTMLSVDGTDVYADEFIYYYNTMLASFQNTFGAENFNTMMQNAEFAETMENSLKTSATNQCAMRITLTNAAKDLGISLSSEDQKTLEANKKETISNLGGTAAYENYLKETGISDRLFDMVNEFSMLYNKIFDSFYGESGSRTLTKDQLKTYFTENYLTANHILKLTVDPSTGAALPDEQVAAAKEKIDEILAQIRGGADFDTLVETESEDTGKTTNPGGYTFTQGDMTAEFYEAALALSEGEISDVVQSSLGYHIIKRLPLDMEYFDENLSALSDSYYEADFYAYITSLTSAADIQYTEDYDNLNSSNLNYYLGK